MIEGVIFDWAGTTVDYGCFAPVNAFIELFREYGIEPTIQETRKPMGMLKIDHIRSMLSMDRIRTAWKAVHRRDFTEEDVVEMHHKFESKLLSTLSQFSAPKPYVLGTVAALRDQGIKIGSTTGYNDKMMEIVAPAARDAGYVPDAWFSPDSTGNTGRPYPFMVFKNMEALKLSSVKNVIKAGDTVSDILEGKNAGVLSVGIIEGSSELALTQEEYKALSPFEKAKEKARVRKIYQNAGADFIIDDIRGLLSLVDMLK